MKRIFFYMSSTLFSFYSWEYDSTGTMSLSYMSPELCSILRDHFKENPILSCTQEYAEAICTLIQVSESTDNRPSSTESQFSHYTIEQALSCIFLALKKKGIKRRKQEGTVSEVHDQPWPERISSKARQEFKTHTMKKTRHGGCTELRQLGSLARSPSSEKAGRIKHEKQEG